MASTPARRTDVRATTASNQPTRRGRPVTVPNSFPRVRIASPTSSWSSDGNGPEPTRVVYAFITATTAPIALGGMPRPVQAPPEAHEEDVTNG